MCLLLSSGLHAQVEDTATYVKNSISIVDLIVHSIDKSKYIRQIFVKDFQNSFPLSPAFNFEGITFKDDGTGNDKEAGDGIYTSIEVYKHSEKVSYDALNPTRSITDKSFCHQNFQYNEQLNEFLKTYKSPGKMARKFVVTFDCDVSWCSCSNTKCDHCYIPTVDPPRGWLCFGCPNVKNCHFVITFEW